MSSLWRVNFRMLKNTSIRGVSKEIRQYEWGAIPGQRPGIEVAWEWLLELPMFKHA